MPSFTRLIVLQVVLVVAAVLYSISNKLFGTTPCFKDPPISLTLSNSERQYVWEDTCRLYSMEYEEARTKFRAALRRYENVELLSLPIAADPENENTNHPPLTIDVAIFPGNTQEYGTIVHSSGLHGVEGYAGSAIQLALLQKDVLPFSDGHEKDRPTMVFLHAINPVGMQEHRRCNENNVDLNRNGIHGNFQDFVNQRDPNIANYDSFRRFLSPTDPDGGDDDDDDDTATTPTIIEPTQWYNTIGIWLNLFPQLCKYGFVSLKRAMVSGQYHHPNGIFYGGRELQPSLQKLQELWDSRPDLFRNAPSLIWIDVHTGLGPFGKDSLHYHSTASAAKDTTTTHFPSSAEELHEQFFTTSHSVTASVTPEETTEAFVGYDLTKGMLTSFFADDYKHGSGLFVTQEFGTLAAILVGRGLILDNMLYQQHKRAKQQQQQQTDPDEASYSYRSPFLTNAFYPQSTAWRSSVVMRGVALVVQSIALSTQTDHH